MEFIIFGSGGLAKEVIGYLVSMYGRNHGIKAVVSLEPFNNPVYNQFNVIEKINPTDFPEARYILAISDPKTKRKVVENNVDKWTSFIHSSAYVSPFAQIGKGCILAPQSVIAGDATLGDFVFFNTNATVGHDSSIGDYSTLFPNSEICGNCYIGEECIFGIGSYVIPNVNLPNGTKVSAGSVVWESISEKCTLVGNPAKAKIRI